MVESKNEVLSISFNQDQACFACGTEQGFKIYNTHPYKDTFQRDFDGGIGIVEMLFRCNILALVGGGKHPKYPLNKVMLWDDHQIKCIGELSFKTNVKAVRLRKDKVVVILEVRIYVYHFSDLKLVDAIDTCPNPKGLCALSPKDTTILVCPDKQKGHIRMQNYDTNNVVLKKAHEGGLAYIALNMEGTYVATASEKGTLIRVFSTKDGKILRELRRGADKAEIFCICFDKSSRFLACTSDKGTVHIFALGIGEGAAVIPPADASIPKSVPEGGAGTKAVKNNKSVFSFMKKIVRYFDSEWSFCQFRIPDTKAICAFGPDDHNLLIVVTNEGNYYLAEIDFKGGSECKKITERPLIPIDE